jgi:hypothetical protein
LKRDTWAIEDLAIKDLSLRIKSEALQLIQNLMKAAESMHVAGAQ